MNVPTVADAAARAAVVLQRPDDPWPIFGQLIAWPTTRANRRARVDVEGSVLCVQPTSVYLFDDDARAEMAAGLTDLRSVTA